MSWVKWFEKANRTVKIDATLPGGVKVSTIFLGLDCSFGEGEPLLFETKIFGGEHDGYQRRYSTWGEAEAGHQEAVKLVLQ